MKSITMPGDEFDMQKEKAAEFILLLAITVRNCETDPGIGACAVQ